MQKISILGVSHYKRENKDFVKLRKEGLPGYNLVHFHQPVVITIDGQEQVTKNNACIFWKPYSYHEYRANDAPFVNDYLTFRVDDPDFEDRFSIPFNQIFYIHNGEEISRMIEWITWAITNTYEYQEISLEEAVYQLLNTLSNMHIDSRPDLRRNFEAKRRFIDLRDKMRQDPKEWTVEKMAKEVWLTRSRFSVLYKEFFEVSPNADLMMIRIDFGKHLLENTDETILRISEMCGYASVEYFIRIFNKQVGISPLQYRKMYLMKEKKSDKTPDFIDLFKNQKE